MPRKHGRDEQGVAPGHPKTPPARLEMPEPPGPLRMGKFALKLGLSPPPKRTKMVRGFGPPTLGGFCPPTQVEQPLTAAELYEEWTAVWEKELVRSEVIHAAFDSLLELQEVVKEEHAQQVEGLEDEIN